MEPPIARDDGAEAPARGDRSTRRSRATGSSAREPVLLGAITLDLMAVLFGGAIALLPAIAEDRLGRGRGGPRVAARRHRHRRRDHDHRRSRSRRCAATSASSVVRGRRVRHRSPSCSAPPPASRSRSWPSRCCRPPTRSASTSGPRSCPWSRPTRCGAGCSPWRWCSSAASNELGAFESGVTGQLFGPAIAIVIGGVASVVVAVRLVVRLPGPAQDRPLPRIRRHRVAAHGRRPPVLRPGGSSPRCRSRSEPPG